MQLNPARGRKLESMPCVARMYRKVYAAQPREGTETRYSHPKADQMKRGLCSSTPRGDGNSQQEVSHSFQPSWFMQLNPARGRKRGRTRFGRTRGAWFMQLNPARGRKPVWIASDGDPREMGLCSSTPRGDGNSHHPLPFLLEHPPVVYAAQPREGTETNKVGDVYKLNQQGLCSSTPRGDGNASQYRL